MTRMLTLNKEDVIAAGGQRAVYQHPLDPYKLIKVLHPRVVIKGRSRFASLTESWFPSLRSRAIRKEYQEYLRTMLANPQPEFDAPFAHMAGFVTTNLGLGCLTEKVVDEAGHLAKNLSQLITKKELTQDHIRLLNDTISRIFEFDVRASDLNASNFVFGHRMIGGKLGQLECVVVDGLGDVHAIPVRSMGRWSNAIGLDDSFNRLSRNNATLEWDKSKRRISTRQIPAKTGNS